MSGRLYRGEGTVRAERARRELRGPVSARTWLTQPTSGGGGFSGANPPERERRGGGRISPIRRCLQVAQATRFGRRQKKSGKNVGGDVCSSSRIVHSPLEGVCREKNPQTLLQVRLIRHPFSNSLPLPAARFGKLPNTPLRKALGLSGTNLTDVAAEAFSRALVEGRSGSRRRASCLDRKDLGVERDGSGYAGGGAESCGDDSGGDSFEVVWGREIGVGGEQEEEEGDAGDGNDWVIPCSLRRLDLSRNGITDAGAR